MKFTFNYKETLERRIVIEADNLAEAIFEIQYRIDNEMIILDAGDFAGGEISMPLEVNSLPQLEHDGEAVKNAEEFDLVIDWW